MTNGYRMVAILDTKFLESRLIFHMMIRPLVGRETVDHRDQDHSNNRHNNLRACSHARNLLNQPGRRSPDGLPKHVHWSKRERKYKVSMRADGARHFIGTFSELADAAAAAADARSRLHGEFADNRSSK